MIQVDIFYQADGQITGFDVRGHSGTAPRGQDIVCAGVSSLTQSALLGIGQHLRRDVDYSVDSGNLSMQLKDAPDSLTEAILQTMLLGLREIEKLSPEAVHIHEMRR